TFAGCTASTFQLKMPCAFLELPFAVTAPPRSPPRHLVSVSGAKEATRSGGGPAFPSESAHERFAPTRLDDLSILFLRADKVCPKSGALPHRWLRRFFRCSCVPPT